jgi:hypothetical protein
MTAFKKKKVNFKAVVPEMYPRITWELVAVRARGATDLEEALCSCDI